MKKQNKGSKDVNPGNGLSFETRAIHSHQEPDEATGGVVVPINLSTTFEQDGVETPRGYQYIRTDNLTRSVLENCFADLEGGEFGFAFSSGIAGVDSVLRLLKPGDHVILGGIIYGGTIKLLQEVYQKNLNVSFDVVDLTNPQNLESALKENTAVVWLESPANPFFNIVDLEALARISKAHNVICVVDNTVATPYLQNPLQLGVDVVVHSATKYLGGHSDVLGGLVATNRRDLADHIKKIQISAGAVLAPFDSYLVIRGIKTLAVRMDQQCENALGIAEMLNANPKVSRVNYAGLADHPGHELAKKQMRNFGGMLSFHLEGGRASVEKLVKQTKIFTFAESLGAVESLISHPATMSHAIVADTEWAVDEGLIRVSVGIENLEDLKADLDEALNGL